MTALYIDRKTAYAKFDDDAIAFYDVSNNRIGTVPIAPLDRIFIHGGVSIDSTLLARLGEYGVGVVFLSGHKQNATMFLPSQKKDAARRITQYRIFCDKDYSLSLAKKTVAEKISTQAKLIQFLAESVITSRLIYKETCDKLRENYFRINPQNNIDSLRALEGHSSELYFNALAHYLPPHLQFTGRNRRPPMDPFNVVLSLGYTLLLHDVTLGLYGAGLDPMIGFYHTLNFGRASLACDLMEPFRVEVDRLAIGMFHREELRAEHFSMTESGCLMGKAARIAFYPAYETIAKNIRHRITEKSLQIIKDANNQFSTTGN